VVLACVRRGVLEFIDILESHGAYLDVSGGSNGYEYDGVSRLRKTMEELEEEEMEFMRVKLLEKQQAKNKSSSSSPTGGSVASKSSKNWTIAKSASKLMGGVRRGSSSSSKNKNKKNKKKKRRSSSLLSKRSSIGSGGEEDDNDDEDDDDEDDEDDGFGNRCVDGSELRSGGFPNLVTSPMLKKRIASMDAEDFLIALNILEPPSLKKKPSPPLSSPGSPTTTTGSLKLRSSSPTSLLRSSSSFRDPMVKSLNDKDDDKDGFESSSLESHSPSSSSLSSSSTPTFAQRKLRDAKARGEGITH
jgi:hypothetical protein